MSDVRPETRRERWEHLTEWPLTLLALLFLAEYAWPILDPELPDGLGAAVTLAILDVERGAEGSNIRSFGDALWWAFTTITTVGYGDRLPVTGGADGDGVRLGPPVERRPALPVGVYGPRGLALRCMLDGKAAGRDREPVDVCPYRPHSRPWPTRWSVRGYVAGRRETGLPAMGDRVDEWDEDARPPAWLGRWPATWRGRTTCGTPARRLHIKYGTPPKVMSEMLGHASGEHHPGPPRPPPPR